MTRSVASAAYNARVGKPTPDKVGGDEDTPVTKFPAPVSLPRVPRPAGPLVAQATQGAQTRRDAHWSVSPAAVVVWLAAQCGVLALGLLQVRLAASMPPGSALFPYIVIAGQVGLGTLLAGFLFRTPATAVVVIAAAWPVMLLAGGLAAIATAPLLTAGLVVSAWLAAVWFWMSACRTQIFCNLILTIAVMFAVGVPILGYLVAEFAVADSIVIPTVLGFAPMGLAWNAAEGSAAWSEALPLGLILLLGLAVRLARGARKAT